jgi:hypothetical protein
MKDVTKLPANNGIFLQGCSSYDIPEEGCTLLLMSSNQYYCNENEEDKSRGKEARRENRQRK